MTAYETIQVLFGFTMLLISVISLTIKLVKNKDRDKK